MEGRMMDSRSAELLLVEKVKSGGYRITRLYPAAAAIFNLFFCAYFERYLNDDANGFYLSFFLFLETTLYAGISSVSFFSVSFEILAKSRIFPTTPTDRLLFIVAGNLRRPIIFSLVGSNVFFLIIFFRHMMPLAILTAALFILLIIVSELLLATLMLVLMRRSVPLESAAVLLGFLLFSMLIGSFVFHFESLLAMNPVLRWTVRGILAARQSDTAGILTNAGWLAMTGVFTLILGRRFT